MTYKKSRSAFANIWSNALTIPRTVMYVITVKLRAVASSPSTMAETRSAYAVTIVKAAIKAADN